MTEPLVRLVVDTDPGIDDALALAVAAGEQRRGRVRVDAICAVAGNVALDRTAANARFVLDGIGLAHVPVWRGAAHPVGESLPASAASFHGEDGLGGHSRADLAAVTDEGGLVAVMAASAVMDGLSDAESVLVAIGPLSNLALAIAEQPEALDRFDRIVVMGGGLEQSSTSLSAYAEFNFFADSVAADRVLGSVADRLTVVPLDVTRQVLLTDSDADGLERACVPQLIVDVLRSGIVGQRRVSELPGMAAHDPLAMAVAVDPTLVEIEQRPLRIVHAGERRGACEPDEQRPPVGVAVEVDADRARRAILDAMHLLGAE